MLVLSNGIAKTYYTSKFPPLPQNKATCKHWDEWGHLWRPELQRAKAKVSSSTAAGLSHVLVPSTRGTSCFCCSYQCSNSRLSSGRQGPVQLLTAFGGTTVIFDLLFLVQEKSFLWCLGPETSCLPERVETQNRLHKNSGNFQIILISGTTWLANVLSY